MSHELHKTIYLKASPEHVWDFLTKPDKLAIWFHRPDTELIANASYKMFKESDGECFMWGKVLDAKPFSRLEYEFAITPMGDTVSTVLWEIHEMDQGVRLSLKHTGIPDSSAMFDLLLSLDKGWDEHLGKIRNSLHK